jgi:hypothetical protein
MKRLRVELDAANARNAVLTEQLARGDSINLGWAVAAGASLLLAGLLWMSSRRERPKPARTGEVDAEGPMTRIVGHRTQAQRAEVAAQAAGAAAPTVAGSVGATFMTGPLSDVQSRGSEDIQVTEMGDEEAIRELYTDYVSQQNRGNSTLRMDLPTHHSVRFDSPTRIDRGTRFGDDIPATRMTVPLTTQLAVDIDLTPDTPTQAPSPPTSTRTLDLDLHLDLPSAPPPAPPKDRKDG